MRIEWKPNLRKGKSLVLESIIKLALARHSKLIIGTSNVDNMYNGVKLMFPDAKVSKGEFCVIVEK